MTEKTEYYSNGKVLITGEYLILHGAQSLAMPVNFGQSIELLENEGSPYLSWESNVLGKSWFQGRFDPNNWLVQEANHEETAQYLQKILKAAWQLNPSINRIFTGKKVICNINFNLEWGLGSSSSLISNIAYLAHTDPFDLNTFVSKGSGYDIACARAESALLYKNNGEKPIVDNVGFDPPYSGHLMFLYLGRKQNTEDSVALFLQNKANLTSEIQAITQITNEILRARTLSDFNYLLREHDLIISSVLSQNYLKEEHFSTFEGEVKSLGAWGGDFALIASQRDITYIKQYFKKKGLSTIISFNDMRLKMEERK